VIERFGLTQRVDEAASRKQPRRRSGHCDVTDKAEGVGDDDCVSQLWIAVDVPQVHPEHDRCNDRELSEPVRPVGSVHDRGARREHPPLQVKFWEAAQPLLDPDDATGIPERLGWATVGEAASGLIAETEPGPDRHLPQEIASTIWQEAFDFTHAKHRAAPGSRARARRDLSDGIRGADGG
jgi:hypothetical protein